MFYQMCQKYPLKMYKKIKVDIVYMYSNLCFPEPLNKMTYK